MRQGAGRQTVQAAIGHQARNILRMDAAGNDPGYVLALQEMLPQCLLGSDAVRAAGTLVPSAETAPAIIVSPIIPLHLSLSII